MAFFISGEWFSFGELFTLNYPEHYLFAWSMNIIEKFDENLEAF